MASRPLFIPPTDRARAEHLAALAALSDSELNRTVEFLEAGEPAGANLRDAAAEQRRRNAMPDVRPPRKQSVPLAYRPGLAARLAAA